MKREEFFIEFNGKKVDYYQDILEIAKSTWKEDGTRKMKDLDRMALYYKPSESKCYYVFSPEEGEPEDGSFTV